MVLPVGRLPCQFLFELVFGFLGQIGGEGVAAFGVAEIAQTGLPSTVEGLDDATAEFALFSQTASPVGCHHALLWA